MLAVLLGGLAGTALRLGADALLPHGPAEFPFSTLIANVAGSFALAVLVARVWPTAPNWLRAGLGPGLLGSFTTFSALVASLLAMAQAGDAWLALVYLLAGLGGGLAAAWLGLQTGRGTAPSRPEVDE